MIDGEEVGVEKCIQVVGNQWRCAVCNGVYQHCDFGRLLCMDPRINQEEDGEIYLVAIKNDAQPEDSVAKQKWLQNERMIKWLQHVTLIEQIDAKIDVDTVKAAIARLNHLVTARLCATSTVQWRKVINQYEDHDCKYVQSEMIMVSSSPELALGQVGGRIPVLPIPRRDLQDCCSHDDLSDILIMVGATVINNDMPTQYVNMGKDMTIPNVYKVGQQSFKDAVDRKNRCR